LFLDGTAQDLFLYFYIHYYISRLEWAIVSPGAPGRGMYALA